MSLVVLGWGIFTTYGIDIGRFEELRAGGRELEAEGI